MHSNAQPDSRPWVDQNSDPIFCRLWTKVHRIKFACVLGPPISGVGGGATKFLTIFYESGSPSNMAKFGDCRPSDLGD